MKSLGSYVHWSGKLVLGGRSVRIYSGAVNCIEGCCKIALDKKKSNPL